MSPSLLSYFFLNDALPLNIFDAVCWRRGFAHLLKLCFQVARHAALLVLLRQINYTQVGIGCLQFLEHRGLRVSHLTNASWGTFELERGGLNL